MPDPAFSPRVVAVFDLDGTVSRCDTYVRFLLHVLRRRPRRWLRALWLPLALAVPKLGWRDNTWLKRTFLGSIAGGLVRHELDGLIIPFVDHLMQGHIRPGALAALLKHRSAGHRLVLATASLDFYAVPLAARLGMDDVVCTGSVWLNERLTDTLAPANCYAEEKLARLVSLLSRSDERVHVHAYSDHYSDRALLDWADTAIGVNPDARLRAHCRRMGYPVVDWETTE